MPAGAGRPPSTPPQAGHRVFLYPRVLIHPPKGAYGPCHHPWVPIPTMGGLTDHTPPALKGVLRDCPPRGGPRHLADPWSRC